ncbi:hypothetical protein Bealeia2_01994 (plasmid) [Candidatus Bealeia paramacronuclearis]|uniref:hypothetical protein n=1 Tax=Candidatus Bealeia paramacronuclearis TaxID=1921001 RepID=UPI002CD6A80D|nr:hypothetical protein [Candidatus Bealeia paramacronuclearis]
MANSKIFAASLALAALNAPQAEAMWQEDDKNQISSYAKKISMEFQIENCLHDSSPLVLIETNISDKTHYVSHKKGDSLELNDFFGLIINFEKIFEESECKKILENQDPFFIKIGNEKDIIKFSFYPIVDGFSPFSYESSTIKAILSYKTKNPLTQSNIYRIMLSR